MSLNLVDLVDADAVGAHLLHHSRDLAAGAARADAQALADEALSFADPSAGAHVLLARLAELDGDVAGFVEHTRLAVRADPTFGPALEDWDHLGFLQAGAGRRAGAARRAELLLQKADRWSGRIPQLDDQFALAGRVLGLEDPRDHEASAALASLWQFLGFLLFEGGLVARFEADCGPLLPAAERDMLASWHDVRHRLVGLEEQRGGRGSFVDVVTGERLDVRLLREKGQWPIGRIGLALLVPADERLALVGEPVLLDDEMVRPFGLALKLSHPRVTEICLRLCFVAACERVKSEHDERVRFALPDVDPDELDGTEGTVLEHLRQTRPVLAARAAAGDEVAESQLLLDAIVAHRIISLRAPHTWELAKRLLADGCSRDAVFERLRAATEAELRARARAAA